MLIRKEEWDDFKKDLSVIICQIECNNTFKVQKYISDHWNNLPMCINAELKKYFEDEKKYGGNNIVTCYDCKKEILAVSSQTKSKMFYINIFEGFNNLIDLNFKSIIHIPLKCEACKKWICGSDFCDCKCFFEENECEWLKTL
ncbi:hypothetical protein SGLAD_v1c03200 [Spiroplasma gladiatoris]|uniref:Uncharacterized protein n=1 Tax=Spiroplasma gladiatoris TaxID=2143 RepID=A0A4V1AQ75_9MOLU|nr:hypothetical protein [Spiroplasma gladiatoris]QBQ07519.1 hypothetical protein SGLAD_v1c03200 [Spiroplasma gladiatoris]